MLNLLAQGQFSCKLVLIAMPSKADTILDSFKNILGASIATSEYLEAYINQNYPISLRKLFTPKITTEQSKKIYIVHDKNDKQIPLDNFDYAVQMLPHATTLLTEKLGHVRLLFDENLIQNVSNWMTEA